MAADSYLLPVIVTAPWTVAAITTRRFLRDPREPQTRALWLAFIFLGLGAMTFVPPVYHATDALLGVHNIADLVMRTMVTAAAFAVCVLIAHITQEDSPQGKLRRIAAIRRARGAFLFCAAVIIAAFASSNAWRTASDPDFTAHHFESLALKLYFLTYLAYLGFALASTAHLTWVQQRHSPHGALRLSLRMMAFGSVMGLGYVVHKALVVTLLDSGGPYAINYEGTVSLGLAGSSLTIIAIGRLLPFLAALLARYRNGRERMRLYAGLLPLWQDLCSLVPSVVLFAGPAGADGARDAQLHPRLQPGDPVPAAELRRLVIEIRDAGLVLRRQVPAATEGLLERAVEAAGLRGLQGESLREAIRLEAGRLAQLQAADSTVDAPQVSSEAARASGGEDLLSDARWLLAVQKQRSTPLAQRTAHQALQRT